MSLEDQDRRRWDAEKIAEGRALVTEALVAPPPGSYAVQGAIAALHDEAPDVPTTDWSQVVALYDVLLRLIPSPVVELNRAVAVAMRDDLAAGLALLDRVAADPELSGYHRVPAARADLIARPRSARRSRRGAPQRPATGRQRAGAHLPGQTPRRPADLTGAAPHDEALTTRGQVLVARMRVAAQRRRRSAGPGQGVLVRLKPLAEQVVVVLGASSGIGRVSALRLAERGAAVVVAARSEPGLRSLVQQVEQRGGRAVYAVCDVADADQVRAVADTAVTTFGRIDTWVNVAAVSVYAHFEDITPEEFRRVTEVSYLGQVHGFLAALPHLRAAGQGALISISSVESMVSLPLHSAYSAAKHAVEGMVDGLRRDLLAEGAPISVTSVKPGTINTPFFNNSLNKMDVKPKGPPPFYKPSVVADCVLYAAEHPVRDLYAGGAARQMALTQLLAPRFVDAVLARVGVPAAKTSEPTPGGAPGALYAPRTNDDRAEGDFTARSRSSAYTTLALHPRARALAVLAGAALPFLLRRTTS